MVGVTEQELTAKKNPYETGTAHLWETARGQIMGLEDGMLKMIFSTQDQRLLGVHILGEGATDPVILTRSVPSSNSYLAGSGRRSSRCQIKAATAAVPGIVSSQAHTIR